MPDLALRLALNHNHIVNYRTRARVVVGESGPAGFRSNHASGSISLVREALRSETSKESPTTDPRELQHSISWDEDSFRAPLDFSSIQLLCNN
jgi:hypothetical protein